MSKLSHSEQDIHLSNVSTIVGSKFYHSSYTVAGLYILTCFPCAHYNDNGFMAHGQGKAEGEGSGCSVTPIFGFSMLSVYSNVIRILINMHIHYYN